jgi:[ribosomal protein S5]-alanine N-acetyltransferase
MARPGNGAGHLLFRGRAGKTGAMTEIRTLQTRRLLLRGVQAADVPSWQRHFADYEVIRYLSDAVPWPYPADGVATHLAKVLPLQGIDQWYWGIFLKAAPEEMIGGITLYREGKSGNRGFWLGRSHWGSGLMSEAVEVTTDFAFDELGFPVLTFVNAVGNPRSRRLKEKAGARLLRVEPATFVDPGLKEQEVWELRPEEWRARRRPELVP